MKTLIISLISILSFTTIASQIYQTQTFKLEYLIHEARAVCWQTCRHPNCEEAEFDIFFDSTTFRLIKEAGHNGKTWMIEEDKSCDNAGSITDVDEHMPRLQMSNPTKAARILDEKGTPVKLAIFSSLREQYINFLKEKLK